MVIKIFTELRKIRMNENNQNFNKEIDNIRNYETQVTELKKALAELNSTLEGFNSRLDEVENGSVI